MRNMQDESNQRLIMIVDDDQALGEMLSIVLESEGFKNRDLLGWVACGGNVPDIAAGFDVA